MTKRIRNFFFLCLGVLVFSMGAGSAAQAQLLISPLHLTMEERERSGEIVVVNTSQQTNTYKLEWMQFDQMEGPGGYVETPKDAKGNHLKDFAVFTPRQITLKAGEKQTIRVGVRRPAELAPGEYRSHLKFALLPQKAPAEGVKDPSLKPNEVKVGAAINASFIIPIVYRVGPYDCKVEIGQPSFSKAPRTGKVVVSFEGTRTGIHGVIGLIDIYHTPTGGKETLIAQLGNGNIFAQISKRNFEIPTTVDNISAGTLRIVFKKGEGTSDKHVVLAEKTFPVGG